MNRALGVIAIVLLHLSVVSAADRRRLPFTDGQLLVALDGTPAQFTAALRTGTAATAELGDRPRVDLLFQAPPSRDVVLAGLAPGALRHWVVVSPSPTAHLLTAPSGATANPWDVAHDAAAGRPRAGYANLRSALQLPDGPTIAVVEPDVSYVDLDLARVMRGRLEAATALECPHPSGSGRLNVCKTRSVHWPFPRRFAWHLEDDYSQLARARDSVPEPSDAERVTVAHLDTGYDKDGTTNPPHLDVEGSFDFTLDPVDGRPHPGGWDSRNDDYLIPNPGHGTGTLGILAAGEVDVQGGGLAPFRGRFGGVPQARVVEYRISGSVVNFNVGPMATAIGHAADAGVDVVSMSMGGVPSQALVDAVNKAYEHGTAVVAAAGNYFVVPVLGVHTPTLTVPPAYFGRVLSVTGVTADGNSYAKAPCFLSLVRGDVDSWIMRGNYGPPFAMDEAVAAYTPNVPWIALSSMSGGPGLVDLDGQGTSAATPQVAAATALWLQKHRRDFDATTWRSWRKVEAAFRAIRRRAKPGAHTTPYRETYFGAGILQAADALEEGVPTDMTPRPDAVIGFAWVDAVFSIIAPADTGPDKLTTSDVAYEHLRRQMFRTEIAQLVFASPDLQDIVGDRRPDDLDAGSRRALLAAIRTHPDCSANLRRAIEQVLASGA